MGLIPDMAHARDMVRAVMPIKYRWLPLFISAVLSPACQDETRTTTAVPDAADLPDGASGTPAEASEPASPAVEPPPEPELVVPPPHKASLRTHPAGQAWIMDPGEAPEAIAIERAEALGYTVVDLSNQWRPFIFWGASTDEDEDEYKENQYASTFVGLANNEIDRDGAPLDAKKANHLELFGIPSTPKVLLAEFEAVADKIAPCLAANDYDREAFDSFSTYIPFARKKTTNRRSRAAWFRKVLARKMKAAKIEDGDYEAAANNKRTASAYRKWRGAQAPVDIIRNTQVRLECSGFYSALQGSKSYEPGNFGWSTHLALAEFQRKHAIFGWGHIKGDDIAVLKLTPEEATYARLRRMLAERVVAASGIIEDGTANILRRGKNWTDSEGQEHTPRDLIGEHVDAALHALGWEDVSSAHEGMRALSNLRPDGYESLLVAVKLPPLPEYYGSKMEFSVLIDRGDVYYDPPYNEEGEPIRQGRQRKPHLTLYVHHLDQKIPLVYWPTTIGSWRSEQHEGHEWLAYKNSDVGPRIWRDIMAAPVWIPPSYTPTRSLIKRKNTGRKSEKVVNYDETGPGFQSAYGLVAAYHIHQVKSRSGEVLRELDHKIRTHGSVDYMSIRSRYSHGCHRLHNGNAVRLFSFLLRRNDFVRHGQTEIAYARAFEVEHTEYKMKINTRGYRYELVEPIPVLVTKGRIRGSAKDPYEGLLAKPESITAPTADPETTTEPTTGLTTGEGSTVPPPTDAPVTQPTTTQPTTTQPAQPPTPVP